MKELKFKFNSLLSYLHIGNPIMKKLNINSVRNKFEVLSDQVKGNIDVFVVSETKIDDSIPNGKLLIDEFSTPYRLDRNSNGGRLMLFVREDIPSNLNLRDDNWLLN